MNCLECGKRIPWTIEIDGKKRNLENRTKCLECMPFKFKKPPKSLEEIRKKAREKSKRNYNKQRTMGLDPRVIRVGKERKIMAINAMGGSCCLCGYNKCNYNIIFHHIKNKSFGLSINNLHYSWQNIFNEMKKCIMLCHNCHGEIHKGMVDKELIVKKYEETTERLKNFDVVNDQLIEINLKF